MSQQHKIQTGQCSKGCFSFSEAVNSYQPDLWKKCVQHVKKEIDEDWLHELDDPSVQEMITNLALGDSDEDDSDLNSKEEDDLRTYPLE